MLCLITAKTLEGANFGVFRITAKTLEGANFGVFSE